MRNAHATWFIGVLALLSAACASVPAPTERVASARAAIRAAREVGAERDPRAALHLQLALRGYRNADRLIDDGDNTEAAEALMCAQADAELALVLARAARAQDDATRAEQRLRVERNPGPPPVQ